MGHLQPDYQPQTCPSWETILTVMSTRTRTEALSGWQDRHQILPSINVKKKKKKRSKCIPCMSTDRHYVHLLKNRIYSCIFLTADWIHIKPCTFDFLDWMNSYTVIVCILFTISMHCVLPLNTSRSVRARKETKLMRSFKHGFSCACTLGVG